jgi:ATP-dependent DNA ligase
LRPAKTAPFGVYCVRRDALIRAELLQDATDAQVKRFMLDPTYVWQEKHNGDRRLVAKQGLDINDFNRNGESGKGLPPNVIDAIRKHPLHKFVIDVEYVQAFENLHVFDTLHIGDEQVVTMPYSSRLSYLHSNFDGYHKDMLPIASATTPQEKVALIERVKGEHGEGFVMKDLTAAYRPSEGNRRWNYRFKFWKTLDAVVIGDSQKVVDGKKRDSVRLGLYLPNGELKDICGATKKSAYVLKPMDVVEVKYLYGTGTLDIVQIDILHQRHDKAPALCTADQIIVNKNWFLKGEGKL